MIQENSTDEHCTQTIDELIQALSENKHDHKQQAHVLVRLANRIALEGQYTALQSYLNTQALALDESNEHASLWQERKALEQIREALDEMDWPEIRQTDHPSTKRRKIVAAGERALKVEEHLTKATPRVLSEQTKEQMNRLLANVQQIQRLAQEYAENFTRTMEGKTALTEFMSFLNEAMAGSTALEHVLPSYTEEPVSTDLIGLEQIKTRMAQLQHYASFMQRRQEKGLKTTDPLALDVILTGNPGTGKTTLARLLAKQYYEAGLIAKPDVIEVHRGHLVGEYVGQSEEKTMQAVRKAEGGVLFIDEAYSLKREGQSQNDYGQAVVDTLVSAMTSDEHRGTFVVVLAGYPTEMRQLLWANPGLSSRFPASNRFHVDDYSTEELLKIGSHMAMQEGFLLDGSAYIELKQRIHDEQVDESFGNARSVKQIVSNAIFHKSTRTSTHENDVLPFILLEGEDFKREQIASSAPEEDLRELVGLHEVKQEVLKVIKLAELQQVRRERGISIPPVQFHAVFTGPPGTGKTTVAKVYAQLLRSTSMLKRGHLVIASRADLIAPYVGQTATQTRKKVREALGGVLFIDEAYALVNGTSGDYGKEAVDTLVDEMTRHNENLVIIMAGYSAEMQLLLQANPGFSGRFKRHLHFSPYTSSELYEIFTKQASKAGYELAEDEGDEIVNLFPNEPIKDNARWAENVLNEAILVQASRLAEVHTEVGMLSDKELATLTVSDIAAAIQKQSL